MERDIQKRIIQQLERAGAYVSKSILSNKNGHPDITACLAGRYIAIEVKDTGKQATALQRYKLNQIRQAGGIAICTDSVEEVKLLVEKLRGANLWN